MKTIPTLIATVVLGNSFARAATVYFEAESGALASGGSDVFNVVSGPAGALGGQAIEASGSGNTAQDATATYNVNISQAGTYWLYARFLVPSAGGGGSDSFHVPSVAPDGSGNFSNAVVRINGLAVTTDQYAWVNTDTAEVIGVGPATDNSNTGRFLLGTGPVEFVMRSRERGLLLDAFVLSTDGNLTASQLDAASIPEPSIAVLCGIGMLGLLRRHRTTSISVQTVAR